MMMMMMIIIAIMIMTMIMIVERLIGNRGNKWTIWLLECKFLQIYSTLAYTLIIITLEM